MAYVRKAIQGGGASMVIDYDADEDDFMFLLRATKYGSATTPSGWTALSFTANGQNNWTNQIWYRRATSSEPTSVTVSATAGGTGLLIICAGVDSTTAFDVTPVSRGSGSTDRGISPAITPVSANCLILYLKLANAVDMQPVPGVLPVFDALDRVGAYYTYSQGASVEVPSELFTYVPDTNNNPTLVTIALRDDGTGKSKGYVYKNTPPVELASRMGDQGGRTGHLTNTNDIDISGVITTLAGITTEHRTASDTIDGLGYRTTYASTGMEVNCGSFTSVDLQGEVVSMITEGTTAAYDNYDARAKYFCLGDGTNFRLWKIDALNTRPSGAVFAHPAVIEVEGGFEDSEVGTVNSTVIGGITHSVLGGRADTSYQNNVVRELYILKTMVIVGGASAFPANMSTAIECAQINDLRLIDNQQFQGQSQFFCATNIQVGNGSLSTYWNSYTQSIEFPAAYSESELEIQFKLSAGKLKFSINLASGDYLEIANTTFNMGNFHKWEIVSGTSSSATYVETGCVVLNAEVTLNDVGKALGDIKFTGCKEITKNSCDLSGGCTIESSSDAQSITINGATQIALQSLLDDLANCRFLSNATAIRVEYTGTGDISLDFDNITWTSNTTDIHYNSTNASELTAVMDNGSNASTTAISGAATGVVISSPVFSLTITSNESASLIQIYTAGTQTLLDSATGTSLVYDHSNETVDVAVIVDKTCSCCRIKQSLCSGCIYLNQRR